MGTALGAAMRLIVATAMLAGLAAAAAVADEPNASRYTIAPSGDGFVRLDTATGAVSHCRQSEGAWVCESAAERSGFDADLAAMAARVQRLSAEVDGLATDIAALRARAAGGPVPPPLGPQSALTPEDERELDRMTVFSDRLFRSFFSMVSELKDEMRD